MYKGLCSLRHIMMYNSIYATVVIKRKRVLTFQKEYVLQVFFVKQNLNCLIIMTIKESVAADLGKSGVKKVNYERVK